MNLQMAKNELQEVGKDVDIVICADDLGTQTGLQMSREHYAKYIKPRHEKFFRLVHELSPAKLLFHTCGSVANIIDDLIEIGVDILNPVQPKAAGMNPIVEKEDRIRIAFWGGRFPVYVTAAAEAEKVVEDLVVKGMGEGGGFVLSSCHNIQPDVPGQYSALFSTCPRIRTLLDAP